MYVHINGWLPRPRKLDAVRSFSFARCVPFTTGLVVILDAKVSDPQFCRTTYPVSYGSIRTRRQSNVPGVMDGALFPLFCFSNIALGYKEPYSVCMCLLGPFLLKSCDQFLRVIEMVEHSSSSLLSCM